MFSLLTWLHMVACPNARVICLSNSWTQTTERTFMTAHLFRNNCLSHLRHCLSALRRALRWNDEQYKYTWFASVAAFAQDRTEGMQGVHLYFPVVIMDEVEHIAFGRLRYRGWCPVQRPCASWRYSGTLPSNAGHFYKLFHDPKAGDGWYRRKGDQLRGIVQQ